MFSPPAEWYEPSDMLDEAAPEVGAEMMSVWSDGTGWWSASADLDDGED